VLKTLDGFDFGAQPALKREAVLELAAARFVSERRNVVLMGEIGMGKTHLAIALGLAACQHELRVRFATAAELSNMLVEVKGQGKLSRKLEQLARYELFVLDELGYVPFDKLGADLLFSFVSRVYEQRNLLVTTNLPYARWGEVFLDATAAAAGIDRVLHHATILKTEGERDRLKDAKRRRRRAARPRERTPQFLRPPAERTQNRAAARRSRRCSRPRSDHRWGSDPAKLLVGVQQGAVPEPEVEGPHRRDRNGHGRLLPRPRRQAQDARLLASPRAHHPCWTPGARTVAGPGGDACGLGIRATEPPGAKGVRRKFGHR